MPHKVIPLIGLKIAGTVRKKLRPKHWSGGLSVHSVHVVKGNIPDVPDQGTALGFRSGFKKLGSFWI